MGQTHTTCGVVPLHGSRGGAQRRDHTGRRLLSEGLTHYPHAAALFNNLATVCEREGRYGDAAAAVERGLQEDAGLAQLQKNAGDYAYRSAHYDDALTAYQRAIRANPALGADVYLRIGNILYRRHDTDNAVRSWTRALELDPGSDVARNNLDTAARAAKASA